MGSTLPRSTANGIPSPRSTANCYIYIYIYICQIAFLFKIHIPAQTDITIHVPEMPFVKI